MNVLDVPGNVLWKIQMRFQESWNKPDSQGDSLAFSGQIQGMEGVKRDYTSSTVGSADLAPDIVLWSSSLFWLLPLNSPQMGSGKRPAAWENNQEYHS